MKINAFFQNVLGANLRNSRWSWGAERPDRNHVYLRVWVDQIQQRPEGEFVEVLNPQWADRSSGYSERVRQLDLMRRGMQGFGVVCVAVHTGTKQARTIKHFDEQTLLEFGPLVEFGGKTYARINGRISVGKLAGRATSSSTLAKDLSSLMRSNLESTVKETLINARIGQGQFRADVLVGWGHCCAVTGVATLEAVRASHIKPWKNSTNVERLDPHNGLPLVATLDALFDEGLISFGVDGALLISPHLEEGEVTKMGLRDSALARRPSTETASYLEWHRKTVFQE